MLAEAKQLEQDGQLNEAAAIYQKIVDEDGSDQVAVDRLLVIYRKLKEYNKELAVINSALAAYEQQDKTLKEKWIKAHPKAAGAGKAIFRKLGGAGMSAKESNPLVNRLLKRKGFAEKKLKASLDIVEFSASQVRKGLSI
jgi:tetratricopeptide (TPR) repeat protein